MDNALLLGAFAMGFLFGMAFVGLIVLWPEARQRKDEG